MTEHHYFNVAIVGGGISGASLMYTLARYTDIGNIALFEKYDSIGSVNTDARSNSQTLHCGDIETNYSYEKAKKVRRTAKMLENYALQHGYGGQYMHKMTKMVIGVGEAEVAFIKERYRTFKELYPYLQLWDQKTLGEIEPYLTLGREEEIVAMGAKGQYSAVDFGAIAESFVENAQKEERKRCELFLNEQVEDIEQLGDKLMLVTNKSRYYADYVVVDAGAHSLLLAHKMGYGQSYSCLPIGGSFFYAKKPFLSSKVYTVQNPKLPFAAVHGDPDIVHENTVRFGPTALALPKLERYHHSHFIEFLNALSPDGSVLKVFYDLLKDDVIRDYAFKNFLYEIPGIRRAEFVKELKKIVPSIEEDDIEYAENVGGLRPQVIDKEKEELLLGEAKIVTEIGVIFNMTPSPGATSCLGNALDDAKLVCDYLGAVFFEEKFSRELERGSDGSRGVRDFRSAILTDV
jgi:malate dehydrogenase (quinone)